jgi:hypothetical protein
MSTPTAIMPYWCACMLDPIEPRLSASTQEAPPCSIPKYWVLPVTGIVPTIRSGLASVMTIPIPSWIVAFRSGHIAASTSVSVIASPTSSLVPGQD